MVTAGKPKCYACGKTARWSIMFCSKSCAAHIALGIIEETVDWYWCSDCKSWVNVEPYSEYHYGDTGKCYGETICIEEYRKEGA